MIGNMTPYGEDRVVHGWDGAVPVVDALRDLDVAPWRVWITDDNLLSHRLEVSEFLTDRGLGRAWFDYRLRYRAERIDTLGKGALGWLIAFEREEDAAMFRLVFS